MISSTSLLSAPSMVGGVHPARDNDVPARRDGPDNLKGWIPARLRPTLAPPVPAESGLATFLRRPCMELMMQQDLQPHIGISHLQDPQTFDAVLQRSRRALRDAAARGGQHAAMLQEALRVLDSNVVLRTQSRSIRNALYQG